MPKSNAATSLAHKGKFPIDKLPLFQKFISQFFLLFKSEFLTHSFVVFQSIFEFVDFDLIGIYVEHLRASVTPLHFSHLRHYVHVQFMKLFV